MNHHRCGVHWCRKEIDTSADAMVVVTWDEIDHYKGRVSNVRIICNSDKCKASTEAHLSLFVNNRVENVQWRYIDESIY